jgi:hypothetical protein
MTEEPPTAPAASDAPRPIRRLSQDLRQILAEAAGRAMTIGQLEAILQGRGFAMFILLLSAPFIVPAPGLSVPFGIALMLLGVRIVFGQKPLLPRFIQRRELSYKTLDRIIHPLIGAVERIEKRIRPRMHFLRDHPWAINLIGVGILSGGFLLALPLPIPFSNGLPALSIMLLAAGMMERDGLLVLGGYITGILSWVYIGFWWKVFVAVVTQLWTWLL